MVYDGSYLRFYLDDLVDSVAATGNLIINPYNTLIGYSAGFNPNWYTQFYGFIDEVRIWNIARSKEQIQEFAFTTLQDPLNQIGLMAYYNFEKSYQNIQGNESFNGIPTRNSIIVPDSINCLTHTGINTLSKESIISIYPNPLYSTGTIRFNYTTKNAELNIYDIYGKKQRTINEVFGDELKIERNNLSSGLYFIVLTQEGKTIKTQKLLIID
jgi:hypothetical protein